jgi:hypothetical protein
MNHMFPGAMKMPNKDLSHEIDRKAGEVPPELCPVCKLPLAECICCPE